jgi:hypothetical protein
MAGPVQVKGRGSLMVVVVFVAAAADDHDEDDDTWPGSSMVISSPLLAERVICIPTGKTR